MARHLLLLDDDDLSREVLTLLFEEDGYEVEAFASGDLAVAHLQATDGGLPVEAVLTDLQMPGTSGPALARELRALLSPGTPIVAMSGSSPASAELSGFAAFLLKPLTPSDLNEALEQIREPAPPTHTAETVAAAKESRMNADGAATVLDEKTFADLALLLRPEQMSELLTLCFVEIRRYVGLMAEAEHQGDRPALRTAAHALKGSVAMLGARELQMLASRLEMGETDAANERATLAEMTTAAERLRRMLNSRGFRLGDAHEDTIA